MPKVEEMEWIHDDFGYVVYQNGTIEIIQNVGFAGTTESAENKIEAIVERQE